MTPRRRGAGRSGRGTWSLCSQVNAAHDLSGDRGTVEPIRQHCRRAGTLTLLLAWGLDMLACSPCGVFQANHTVRRGWMLVRALPRWFSAVRAGRGGHQGGRAIDWQRAIVVAEQER